MNTIHYKKKKYDELILYKKIDTVQLWQQMHNMEDDDKDKKKDKQTANLNQS